MDELIVVEYGTPRIAGKRINVYDIMDGLRQNWPPARIAEWFEISIEQVNAAIRYIDDNRNAVESVYQSIIDRHAKGNTPELQERLMASKGKAAALRARLRNESMEIQHARDSG
jgi:uncharacterized protein (DUF433 family)